MQWKEFLLGNRANKLSVWTETQGQICGAVGDVETHVLWDNCIVKNQCIREDFQSDFFYYECIFPLKTEKPGMIQCPLKVILWLRMFTPEDTTYSNFKSE